MATGLLEHVKALRDTATALTNTDLTNPTNTDFLQALLDLETATRQLSTAVNTRMTIEIATRNLPQTHGFSKIPQFLKGMLRVSGSEAYRRVRDAHDYGETRTLTGETLPSRHPHVAEAMRTGEISTEHLREIGNALRKIPDNCSPKDLDNAETILTSTARTAAPEDVKNIGIHLLAYLDPDGKLSDPDDRARKRSLRLSRQDTDLMSSITGSLDPQTRAKLDVVLAKWAKPGMNNADDDLSPRGPYDETTTDKTLLEQAAGRDRRTQEQRNHDALAAVLDWILSAGELGEHNGLPMHVIVTMTLAQLESETGVATTATGGVVPVADALRMSSNRHHYLCLLDLNGRPLHFARERRTANLDQRLALFAAERGCTGPHCTVPAAGSQVHHRDRDFQHGGNTDINELTFACGCQHHHLDNNDGEHEPDGWYTRTGAAGTDNAGRTEWIPPATVDPLRRPIVNDHHLPDILLKKAAAERREREIAFRENWSEDDP